MRWNFTNDAELNALMAAEEAKSKEIAVNQKAMESTKNTTEEINLLQQAKALLLEQSNLLAKIADRMKIIKSKIKSHEEKAAA